MLLCLSGSQQHCSVWPALILWLVNIHRRVNSLSVRAGGREAGREGESEGQMGEVWLEGGTMRPKGRWILMCPDYKVFIQIKKRLRAETWSPALFSYQSILIFITILIKSTSLLSIRIPLKDFSSRCCHIVRLNDGQFYKIIRFDATEPDPLFQVFPGVSRCWGVLLQMF